MGWVVLSFSAELLDSYYDSTYVIMRQNIESVGTYVHISNVCTLE